MYLMVEEWSSSYILVGQVAIINIFISDNAIRSAFLCVSLPMNSKKVLCTLGLKSTSQATLYYLVPNKWGLPNKLQGVENFRPDNDISKSQSRG